VLFLLNDTVFAISGGLELVNRARMPLEAVRTMRLPEVVQAVQTALFDDPDFVRNEPEKAAALCWLLAARSQANAALFVSSLQKPRKPADIGYRLAQVAITTLGSLQALQQQGRSSAAVVNACVWQARAA
jgi:hypothetical protein